MVVSSRNLLFLGSIFRGELLVLGRVPLHSSSRFVEDLGVLNFQPIMSYQVGRRPLHKNWGKTGDQIPPKYNTINIPPTKASRNSSKKESI